MSPNSTYVQYPGKKQHSAFTVAPFPRAIGNDTVNNGSDGLGRVFRSPFSCPSLRFSHTVTPCLLHTHCELKIRSLESECPSHTLPLSQNRIRNNKSDQAAAILDCFMSYGEVNMSATTTYRLPSKTKVGALLPPCNDCELPHCFSGPPS